MKRAYDRPVMNVELFMANQGVAASCTITSGVKWTFDCMIGPTADAEYCVNDQVANGCQNQAGYAPGIDTARDYTRSSNGHSNNSSVATWTKGTGGDGGGSYVQVQYTGAQGILYISSMGKGSGLTTKGWNVSDDGYVWHASSNSTYHHNVAPVLNAANISTSW